MSHVGLRRAAWPAQADSFLSHLLSAVIRWGISRTMSGARSGGGRSRHRSCVDRAPAGPPDRRQQADRAPGLA